MPITRRSFLNASLALVPMRTAGAAQPYRFRRDHVLGTSMDLTVWTRSSADADAALTAALDEIDRLDGVLSTYREDSDISRYGAGALDLGAPERGELLRVYDAWRVTTGGALSASIGGRLNVNALGKAFVLDRVAAHLRTARPAIDALVLDIGGDIVSFGRPVGVGVADPARWYENDPALTQVTLQDAAVATSGRYARGAHLIDPRTGKVAMGASAATVIAPDCVTANALTTALCVLSPDEGMRLVARTPGAEALVTLPGGAVLRSAGFARMEGRPTIVRAAAVANWPAGYEVGVTLTLKGPAQGAAPGGFGGRGRGGRGGRGGAKPPYVAIWIAAADGQVVRTVTVWGNESRWLRELPDWMAIGRRTPSLVAAVTRATRPAGEYRVVWNGLDDKGAPLPTGSYTIHLEVNREHGNYARRSGVLVCAAAPVAITLPESQEFGPVAIAYGPRPGAA